MKKQKAIAIKCISLLLVLALFLPVNVMAVESRASYYLDAYSAYIYPAGWGKVQVWFDVTAVRGMDVLGVSEVIVQRSTDGVNWSDEAFYYDMYRNGSSYYGGHVTYSDVTSGYYRAQVTYYAEDDTGVGEYTARTSSFHY